LYKSQTIKRKNLLIRKKEGEGKSYAASLETEDFAFSSAFSEDFDFIDFVADKVVSELPESLGRVGPKRRSRSSLQYSLIKPSSVKILR